MSKAEDLMIGDWVCINPITYYKVKEIRFEYNEYRIFLDNTCVFATGNEIMPIPLTPEILEKNGWKHEFDKTDYMVKYNLGEEGENCWMMWAVKEHNLDIQRQDKNLDMYNLKVSRVVIPCDYVHELQHAMHLCGIEKTIEL